MVQSFYFIKEKFADKKKYVWEIGTDTMGVVTMLSFLRIDICGFLTEKEKFVGMKILNRPIIGIQDQEIDEDALIICHDRCDKSMIKRKLHDKNPYIASYTECIEADYRLREKEVILYGMGDGSKAMEKILENARIKIAGYALTDKGGRKHYKGKPIYNPEEIPKRDDIAVIIAVFRKDYEIEIRKELIKTGVKNIYFGHQISEIYEAATNPLLSLIDKNKEKDIYIFGVRNEDGILVEDILNRFSVPLRGYIKEDDIYERYGESSGEFFIIPDTDRKRVERKCNLLEKAGISINELSYAALVPAQIKHGSPKNTPDCLMGYVRDSSKSHYGIEILGGGEKPMKVIVLGGSTSTVNVFRPKSWVHFLYERLKELTRKDVIIYDFANSGNDVVVELLKLLRDGHFLQPDYVISLSGVNNTVRRITVNQFNVVGTIQDKTEWGATAWLKALDPDVQYCSGIEEKEDLFDFWRRTQMIIKTVAELYGAKYIGVLQPMDCVKPDKTLMEAMLFPCDYAIGEGAESFYGKSREDDFYLNLMHIFEKEENMYVDQSHYTKRANYMIAERIVREILHIEEEKCIEC